MCKKGFTLIEILVVILIIGSLMGMLIPGLAASRAAARVTQDASNLRQITMAWIQLQQVKQGAMMPWMTHDVVNEPNYVRYWFGAVDQSTTPAKIVFKDGFLADYLESDERVFVDPDFGPDNVTETRYNAFTTSYAYNRRLGPGTSYKFDSSYTISGVWEPGYTIQSGDDPSGTYPVGTIIPPVCRNSSSVKYSARTVVFADSAIGLGSDYTSTALRENWSLDAPDPGTSYFVTPTVHYRHRGKVANLSFADGHVEQVQYTPPPATLWSSYSVSPSETQIKWFDEQKLGFFGVDNSAYNPSGKATEKK